MPNKHDDARLTEFQRQVAIGSMLGDMSASKPANGVNYHLSCYHSDKQLDWLEQKWDWLKPHTRPIQLCTYTDKRDGKARGGGRFHTISAPCFSEIAGYFYQDGTKIIPYQIASLMTHPVALACLICDDGSWDGAGISIATKQFTKEDNYRIAGAIADNFSLSVSVMTGEKYPHIRITAASVEKALGVCRPYILPAMIYKFGGGDYKTRLTGLVKKNCAQCGQEFSSYEQMEQLFCSRDCAAKGRRTGYQTRTNSQDCPICGREFVPYVKRQKTCIPCREKPFPDELCVVCGNPVISRGSKTCSRRCNVIAGHRTRKIG